MTPLRVTVVGSGVAGLTAAHILGRTHDVTLFERDERLGGHANTIAVRAADGREVALDTGFIVHNQRTYPTLLRLFAELGIATQESDMSFGVRCEGCDLEYAGAKGMHGVVPRAGVLGRPRYLRMLVEVRRFHRHARAVLSDPAADDLTLHAFLRQGDTRTTSPTTSCCRSPGDRGHAETGKEFYVSPFLTARSLPPASSVLSVAGHRGRRGSGGSA